MEFLKDVFGEEALTYSQLAEKLKDNKDVKLANLATGEYVTKQKLSSSEDLLTAANKTIGELQATVKKFDGVDIDKLNGDLKALQGKYDQDVSGLKLNSALDMALLSAKARDVKAIKPFLDMETIKLDGDKLMGLDEQLGKLKTDKDFLFDGEKTEEKGPVVDTGGNHGDPLGGGLDGFINSARTAAGLKTD